MKQSRIGRVVKILTTLQSGEKYSPGDLENLLGVSRRTIFRDLKELQSIGVPYKYSQKTKGYSIDPKFFLPPIDFTLAETLSLLTLIHKMRNHLPLPFRNSSLLAGLKIENNLPAEVRKYCQLSLQKVTIAPAKSANIASLDHIYRTIQKAIKAKSILSLQYHSLYEKKTISAVIHPYHLLYKNRSWYAIGYSVEHKSVRTFNLTRIKLIEKQDRCFTGGNNFDLQDYLGRAWSLIPEGKIYNIELHFSALVAQNVTEVQWHSTQSVKWNQDGSAIVSFRVDGLGEITWWVLGYGDLVRVVAPAILRKKVLEKAQKIIKSYQASGQLW